MKYNHYQHAPHTLLDLSEEEYDTLLQRRIHGVHTEMECVKLEINTPIDPKILSLLCEIRPSQTLQEEQMLFIHQKFQILEDQIFKLNKKITELAKKLKVETTPHTDKN